MQHPFAGILESDQALTGSTVKSLDPVASRRRLLGVLTGLISVGTVGFLAGSKAQAQTATTLAVGEEGGRHATTYAVGEEGGRHATTYAAGEEGGRRVTTYAVGEEGGRPPVRVRG